MVGLCPFSNAHHTSPLQLLITNYDLLLIVRPENYKEIKEGNLQRSRLIAIKPNKNFTNVIIILHSYISRTRRIVSSYPDDEENVLQGYHDDICQTPTSRHNEKHRCVLPSFFFRGVMSVRYYMLRRSRNAHDFLCLFMETREVCESVRRGGEERKVAKRRGKGLGDTKANSRAVRESSCTCVIPIFVFACNITRVRVRVTTKAPDNFR